MTEQPEHDDVEPEVEAEADAPRAAGEATREKPQLKFFKVVPLPPEKRRTFKGRITTRG